jgi:hypothetical protein
MPSQHTRLRCFRATTITVGGFVARIWLFIQQRIWARAALVVVRQQSHEESSMKFQLLPFVISTIFATSAFPALADDCAVAAKSAMLATAQKPLSSLTTKTAAQGKQSATGIVQTETNKHVQVESGQWYVMDITIKDLIDSANASKVICKRSGSETVNGQPAVWYEVQVDTEGVTLNDKIWVSSKNFILKSEGDLNGSHYVTVYDFSHVTPPANAKRMGGN